MTTYYEELPFKSKVIDFLKDKGFPDSSILQDAPITDENYTIRPDIILINEQTKDYLAVIEIKRILNNNLESSKHQLLRYLRGLNRFKLTGFIFGFDENIGLEIFTLNKNNELEKLDSNNFPNYNSLKAVEEKKSEISKLQKKRENVDKFLWICIGAAIVTITLFFLSLFNVLTIDDKELTLLLITIGLVIIPFVAKLEILGIVFERKSEK